VFDLFTDHDLEAAARAAIGLDEPRALLDRFKTLVRESGTADEHTAGHYLVERLQAFGVPVTLHTPDLYISLPERAANVCFGGPKRNRLFVAGCHSIYALYVNTQGAPGG